MSPDPATSRPPESTSARRSHRHTPDDARREIVECAVGLLWDHPFRDLTIRRLMAGTTLSRPAFYHYFDDLHHLMETLLDEVEAEMHETANPWIGGIGEPVPALRESLAGVVRVAREHGPVFRAIAESSALDARLEKAWSTFMGKWDGAVEARIRAEQALGRVPPLDACRMAHALNRLDAAVLIAEFGRRPQGDPRAVLDTLHRIWTSTLYPSAERPGAE